MEAGALAHRQPAVQGREPHRVLAHAVERDERDVAARLGAILRQPQRVLERCAQPHEVGDRVAVEHAPEPSSRSALWRPLGVEQCGRTVAGPQGIGRSPRTGLPAVLGGVTDARNEQRLRQAAREARAAEARGDDAAANEAWRRYRLIRDVGRDPDELLAEGIALSNMAMELADADHSLRL